ncbi:hypothetical protein [Streptomyces yangpuensis]|uniref:hypothetical protein n=1 Tax=Streptomyces yangpuensis TaxID=1648182 RepID=UPI00371C90DC
MDHEPFQKPPSTRQDTTRQRRRWRWALQSLTRAAGHGIVRGAATALGMSLMGWIIWWVQQR